jgi:hypothetical protein
MDTFSPYDLDSALESAIKTALRTQEQRYVLQTARGYQVSKSMGHALYCVWAISPAGIVSAISLA